MSLLEEVKQAKALHKEALFARPNVVGVGVGYKQTRGQPTEQLSVVVLVRQKMPLAGLLPEAVVPQEVAGVPTDVLEVGDLRSQQVRTDRWRPAPGGVSIGHYRITAGTFGCVVRDRASGMRLILSNNHVLANSNDASPGDAILQPGTADKGQNPDDVIAHLERFCPIQFSTAPSTCTTAALYAEIGNKLAQLVGSQHRLHVFRMNPQATNTVDAAVARPVDDSTVVDEILEIGVVDGTVPAALGMPVRKSGRTTGLTSGEITVMDATVNVGYGGGSTVTFENQLLTGPMSQGGDSGSLLVAGDSLRAVGLLFAGSNQSTVYNPIQAVLDCLSVDIISGAAVSKQAVVQSAIERAQVVKQIYQEELMRKANVIGVGVGLRHQGGMRTDQVVLVVMVRRKLPLASLAPEDVIPSQIEGVPVDVREVGEVEAQRNFRF